jgi:hypothetical protein
LKEADMSRRIWVVAIASGSVAALAAASSCRVNRTAPLVPPRADEAADCKLVVSWPDVSLGPFDERRFEVNDRRRVEWFLAFVRERGDGWHKPWDTFPTPQYTVVVERERKPVQVFWVAKNWIGGREWGEDASQNRLRRLSEDDWIAVLEKLGIPNP